MIRRCAIWADRVAPQVGGELVRPPGHDGGVGQQQRDDDRLAVLGQLAVQPHDDAPRTRPRRRRGGSGRPSGPSRAGSRRRRRRSGRGAAGEASLAASMISSAWWSSTTMTSVSTRPSVIAPTSLRSCDQLLAHRGRRRLRQVDDHGILQVRPSRAIISCGRRRTPAAGRVRLGPSVLGPPGLDRVEDLPGQLDLLVPGEERRVAEQDVEDQALVCLGAGLRERVTRTRSPS